jgi:hypothetical protein
VIAEEFLEELGLEFAHNLADGWEEKMLQAGARVLSYRGNNVLKTAQDIKKALSEAGQIQFFAPGKNQSHALLNALRKPAKERWS